MIVLDGQNSIDILEFMLHKWKVSPSCIIAYSENDDNIFESNIEKLTGSVDNAVRQGKAPECDIITVMSGLLGEKHSAPGCRNINRWNNFCIYDKLNLLFPF